MNRTPARRASEGIGPCRALPALPSLVGRESYAKRPIRSIGSEEPLARPAGPNFDLHQAAAAGTMSLIGGLLPVGIDSGVNSAAGESYSQKAAAASGA